MARGVLKRQGGGGRPRNRGGAEVEKPEGWPGGPGQGSGEAGGGGGGGGMSGGSMIRYLGS